MEEVDVSELCDKQSGIEVIRSSVSVTPVISILERMKNNTIIIDNDNLENNTIAKYEWKKKKKSLLIESLLLGIPIAAFYFWESDNFVDCVIDGRQRLQAIEEFVSGNYKLASKARYLYYGYRGKTFKELNTKEQNRILYTSLTTIHLDPRLNELAVKEIRKRINSDYDWRMV